MTMPTRKQTQAPRKKRAVSKKGSAMKVVSSKAVKRSDDTSVTAGSGNIFADLGIPDADTELLKAQLTLQIHTIIKQRGLTQTHAGEILGIQQPHVSLLMRNRSGTFSVGRLMEFLAALGQDVEITVRPTRRAQGALSVVTAHPRRKGMPATPLT